MNTIRSTFLASTIALLLCSCNPGTTVSTDRGNVVAKGDRVTLQTDGHPNAHIDEAGDLLVDGEKVEVNPRQRALLQTYRREFNGMTEEGLAIGKRGAVIAGKAVTAAIKSAMGGNKEMMEESIKADARIIEQEALKLCSRLATIRGVQDHLAIELPAFRPYATIDMSDVEDCQGSASDTFDIPASEEADAV